jgi:flagellar protein FliO/FliZ
MFDGLFSSMETITKFFIAFAIVLALMAITFWVWKRLSGTRIGGSQGRARQPRLAVIDAAVVDGRRRLVLVRRDNVEHLLMIGGPSDVVIEQNIVRAVPVAPARELPATRGNAEPMPRAPDLVAPRVDNGASWPLQPEPPIREPEPVVRQRPARPIEPEPAPMPRPQRLLEPEPMPRSQRLPEPEPPPMPRAPEPMPRPIATTEQVARQPAQFERPAFRPAPPPPIPAKPAAEPARAAEPRAMPPSADANLADMAQRLEAALRRPAAAGDNRGEPAAAPTPDAPRPPRDAAEPARPAAPDQARPAPADPRPASPKSVLDSLEQEMASLLGRPAGKE